MLATPPGKRTLRAVATNRCALLMCIIGGTSCHQEKGTFLRLPAPDSSMTVLLTRLGTTVGCASSRDESPRPEESVLPQSMLDDVVEGMPHHGAGAREWGVRLFEAIAEVAVSRLGGGAERSPPSIRYSDLMAATITLPFNSTPIRQGWPSSCIPASYLQHWQVQGYDNTLLPRFACKVRTTIRPKHDLVFGTRTLP